MIDFSVTLLHGMVARAQRLHRAGERGASVLEWALIAAVLVVAASIIGAVVFNIVQNKSNDLEDCANQPAGSAC